MPGTAGQNVQNHEPQSSGFTEKFGTFWRPFYGR